jgi:2',3'-cyclic-nucleotide 2'-phosphodiesterase (5'-nucleotidase family)
LKTRFIWKQMEKMGYLASTPGVRELDQWPLYQELLSTSKIQCVSSNLTVVENGVPRPAGLPMLVTDVGGVKVGFFALLGGPELMTAKPPEGIEFRHADPVETAKRIVPELAKQAEIVVLLSELSQQETEFLIQQVPGIDVAMFGRMPQWNDRAQKIGETITQKTGSRAQYLGDLVLIVDPDGRIIDWGSRNAPLDAKFAESAEVLAEVKQIEVDARETLKSETEKRAAEQEHKTSSERFIGTDKCQRCHAAEFAEWSAGPHAKAFDTLVAAGRMGDKDCVGCHVTGFEQPSGFTLASLTEPDMRHVQCEACHDVGTKHGRGELATSVTEATCTKCHTGEWAKGFNFAEALPLVDHSKR